MTETDLDYMLLTSTIMGNDKSTVRIMLDMFSLPSQMKRTYMHDQTPLLFTVATKGDVEMMQILLDAGSNINITNEMNLNVFYYLCLTNLFHEHKPMLDLLAQRGIRLKSDHAFKAFIYFLIGGGNTHPKYGGTRLKCDPRTHPTVILEYVLQKMGLHISTGMNRCKLDDFIWTIHEMDDCLFHQLLEAGLNPNICYVTGETFVYIAVMRNEFDRIRMLMQFGADVNIECLSGYTAWDICQNEVNAISRQIIMETNHNIKPAKIK